MTASPESTDLRPLLMLLRESVGYCLSMGQEELLIGVGEELDDPPPESLPAAEARPRDLGDPTAALAEIETRLEGCTRCPLSEARNNIVYGSGSPTARLVFVGEGPGAEEDRLGLPFVGAAGQLLDRIIAAIGLSRQEVYICNVVKCRPPQNRTPLPDERATCGPFLEEQLEVIRPEVIVALGATAANDLLGTETSMSRLRGRFHPRGDASVMPTYHPAYLLRNPAAKRAVWEDMKKVRDRLGLTR